jgi:EAL domain-containing protein (putative c-di-GMP-specific phosphodiesterase class I)
MEKYQFPAEIKTTLETLPQPFAAFQYVDGRIVPLVISEGFCELFGYRDRESAYKDLSQGLYEYIHPDDAERISKAGTRFIAQGGKYDVVYRTRNREEERYQIVHAAGRHIQWDDGLRIAYIWYTDEGFYTEAEDVEKGVKIGSFRSLVNNVLHEGSILKAIQYDHLTGLPSMTHFFGQAEAAKKAMTAAGKDPVLLYMDLGGMKFFNSWHSFAVGDRLLQSFAGLLIRTFGEECCCRAGADHFGAFAEGAGLEATLDRFLEEVKEINEGNSLPVHIGVYANHMGDVPVSTAYDRAKVACDVIKHSFDSGWYYYDKRLRDAADKRQYILSHLDTALRERWIKVYYQPIVRAVNGRVCDEEALARWQDPERGLLSPGDFIPVLESAGVNYKLDLYMLERILERIETQKRAGLTVVPHSLNLSRSDFDACDIVEEIRKRVDAAGVERGTITIEITESMLGHNFDFMKEQVERFQKLGFPVWMDDFGSGYSTLDVLQSIRFNLLKFDMSFMQKLDDGENGKIILTELMKMAHALGVDTVCEGVETKSQVQFLQEIGCSKLQGYYFSKPIPLEEVMRRYEEGRQIGYENPDESAYYEAVGRLNLYDLSAVVGRGENVFHNIFDTLPMGIIEIDGDDSRFIRTNRSYREFMMRAFGFDLTDTKKIYTDPHTGPGTSFMRLVRHGSLSDDPVFIDEQLPDSTSVRSCVRKIGVNPVNGRVAVAVVVISVSEPEEGMTYASIARALAADYYNLYYVDLNTGRFIEYSSTVGGEELAVERHGEQFFETARKDTMHRIYEEDREAFLARFTRESILRELDAQGVFTANYRLTDTGKPMYVYMKIMRMQPSSDHLIIGISVVDRQMKAQVKEERIRQEEAASTRVMALSGDYLSLYTIEPETGRYYEYSTSDEYERLGLAKTGDDFFRQGIIDAKKTVFAEDLPQYLSAFTRDNVLDQIRGGKMFQLNYRLVIDGSPKRVTLKIVSVHEKGGEKLIAGIRAWRERGV